MDVALNVSSLDFTSGLAEYLRGGHILWAYGLLALTTAPPLVPNSVLLVTGGVMAAEGRLNLALVLLVVACSAVLGDLAMHRTGRALSSRVLARMHRRPRRQALLNWAALRIQRHGVPFVIGVRFLPSGRVIGGLAAGIMRYPVRRYAIGAGVAEAVWASYSVGAGYVSGRAASNSFFALAMGLGISLLVAGIGTGAQWVSRVRERRTGGGAVRPSAVVAAFVAGDGPVTATGRAEPPLKAGGPALPPPPGPGDAGPSFGPRTVGPPAGPREGRDGTGTVSCSSGGHRR